MTSVPPGGVTQSVRGDAIQQVAIIGAGAGGPISGATLALLCGQAGFRVVLEDVLPGNLRRAAQVVHGAEAFPLRYAASIEDAVREADLVIDTVPDELESKLEILSLLDRMAPPAALFATPTEALSIADLASCTYRAGQCFGLRFLGLPPAPLHVVLNYPAVCTQQTVARMEAFLHALGARVEGSQDLRSLP